MWSETHLTVMLLFAALLFSAFEISSVNKFTDDRHIPCHNMKRFPWNLMTVRNNCKHFVEQGVCQRHKLGTNHDLAQLWLQDGCDSAEKSGSKFCLFFEKDCLVHLSVRGVRADSKVDSRPRRMGKYL